jgi:hypothetical protein
MDISSFILGALSSGVAVAWAKDKLEQNSGNKRRIRETREVLYKDFVNNLMGFRKGWEDKNKMRQFIFDVNTNATVSTSDEVYRLAKKYIMSFDKKKKVSESKRQKIYAQLVIVMRNELNELSGESPTTLKESEIEVLQLD